mmetsp:Transcript_42558/g.139821  ORF Transcript_42558/g.139821 Transcript_42558/m.139821 type:complete len:260 (-) Transcript_42558:108-887(-)
MRQRCAGFELAHRRRVLARRDRAPPPGKRPPAAAGGGGVVQRTALRRGRREALARRAAEAAQGADRGVRGGLPRAARVAEGRAARRRPGGREWSRHIRRLRRAWHRDAAALGRPARRNRRDGRCGAGHGPLPPPPPHPLGAGAVPPARHLPRGRARAARAALRGGRVRRRACLGLRGRDALVRRAERAARLLLWQRWPSAARAGALPVLPQGVAREGGAAAGARAAPAPLRGPRQHARRAGARSVPRRRGRGRERLRGL